MWTAPRTCMHACPRQSMACWLSCGDASNARNIMRLIRPASASARRRARYQVQLLPCKHWRRRRPDEMDRASTSSPAGDRAAGAGRWRFSPSGSAATHVLLRTRSRLVARPCTATSSGRPPIMRAVRVATPRSVALRCAPAGQADPPRMERGARPDPDDVGVASRTPDRMRRGAVPQFRPSVDGDACGCRGGSRRAPYTTYEYYTVC